MKLCGAMVGVGIVVVGRSPWREGNHISTHLNGDGFYPVMLEAIGRAGKSNTFESFVDKQTRMFERDRAGCRQLGSDGIPHRLRDLPMNIVARALAGQL